MISHQWAHSLLKPSFNNPSDKDAKSRTILVVLALELIQYYCTRRIERTAYHQSIKDIYIYVMYMYASLHTIDMNSIKKIFEIKSALIWSL